MWALMIIIYYYGASSSIVITSIDNFTSEKKCIEAGQQSKLLVKKTLRDIDYICIEK